jgi:CubicO group peptidase (beta-lactamase class C family)
MDLLQSDSFRKHAQSLMEDYKLPSLSISISQDNKVSSIGLGVANLHKAAECTPDTLYDITSSSKSLTAACVALLVKMTRNIPKSNGILHYMVFCLRTLLCRHLS